MSTQDLVTYFALGAGVICLIIYVYFSLHGASNQAAAATVASQAKSIPGVSIDDLTKLIDTLAKLTDSLGKAGPALTSLVGAVLFFAIAAVSSGALKSAAPAASHAAAADAAANSATNTP